MHGRFKENYKIIGMNIAYYRRWRDLTQEELAAKGSISHSYLSKIECGNYNKAFPSL